MGPSRAFAILATLLIGARADGQARFIENRGQWEAGILYQAEMDGARQIGRAHV